MTRLTKVRIALASTLALVTAAIVLPSDSNSVSAAVSSACQISNPVFCDTFDAPQGAGTRTGDLDPVLWGVSRLGQWNDGNGQHNRVAWPTSTVCGNNGPVEPPQEVQICNGRLFEAVNDNHNVGSLHMYPKQPFDFAGRTGVASFDVGADSEGPHGAWPEFVITDKPVPGTRSDISNQGGTSGNNDVPPPAALNEVGIALDGGCTGQPNTTGVGLVFVARNGGFQEQPFTQTGCVQKGDLTHLNHFEFRVSQNHLEVWGTDPGSSTLRQLAVANNINLTFTRGLVWIDDVHYNGDKFPNPVGQRDHQIVWDNLGFDGPPTYRDLGFDVADNNQHLAAGTTDIGYLVGNGQINLNTAPIRSDVAPTGAQVVFNYTASTVTPPQISVNGNPFIITASPFSDTVGYLWRSISVPIPLAQVNDARNGGTGANTLTFKSTDGLMTVTNISIILVAGAVVPGDTTPPTTTTTLPVPTSTSTSTTTVPVTSTTAPATTTTTTTTTTTVPAQCTVTTGSVHCPAGYTGDIYVGTQQIWPQSSSTTTTTIPVSTTTTVPATTTTTTSVPPTTSVTTTTQPSGSAGCGLSSAAFCDSFTTGSGGHNGDLSSSIWQVGRVVGEVNSTSELNPFPNVPVGACKTGVTQASADNDILVCNSAGRTGQALVALGAQNYGLISLSPRQPFDFAGRTGTIAANVDMVSTGNLGYWTSLFVTDQPVPVASSGVQVLGYLPRNGFGVTLDATCNAGGTKAGVGSVTIYNNTVETTINNPSPTCVTTARGSLNHLEVRVSQNQLSVWASDAGGANFRQIFTTAVTLPFTRGFVHYQTAERAPGKYSVTPGYTTNYWSNLGFDGPVISKAVASLVPDSLTSGGTRGTNTGYSLTSGNTLTLSIPNVPASPTTASLIMSVELVYGTPGSVSYSLNGGPVHVAPADVVGQSKCTGCPGPSGGQGVGYAFPVAVSELHAGTNTLSLTGSGFTGGWPFVVSNVELQTI